MTAAGRLDVRPIAGLHDVRADWDRLAAASGSVYATWEWATTWWDVYGAGRRLLLHGLWDAAGELVAILPLYQARGGPVPLARLVGHGPADELAPVCAPEHRTVAAGALRVALRHGLGARALLLAERLPADQGWAAALRGRPLRTDSTPLLRIDGKTWDEWLKSRSSNFRQQVRRHARNLERDHDVDTRQVTEGDELDAALDTLVALHDARWGEESSAFDEQRRRFHRAFAHAALGRGWLRLWLTDLDGRPAAAWIGFRYGGAEWYYQAGRDPQLDESRVGFVLLCRTIQAAFDDGQREYRFGLGDEPYKDRFADDDPGLDTVVAGAAPVAAAASAGVALVRKLPPAIKGRVAARVR